MSLRRLFVRQLATARRTSPNPLATAFKTDDDEEPRYRDLKNPEIPSLKGLSKRWERMDALQQDDVIAYLEDVMRDDWKKLDKEQRDAIMYVAYGPWGPRSTKKEKDAAGLLNAYMWTIGVSGLALITYKYATFDPKKPIPGIDSTQ